MQNSYNLFRKSKPSTKLNFRLASEKVIFLFIILVMRKVKQAAIIILSFNKKLKMELMQLTLIFLSLKPHT